MSTMFGVVFFSHQIGSFLGVWLGGRLFDAAGDYRAAWWAAIGLGLFAMLIHLPIDDGGSPAARKSSPTAVPPDPAASSNQVSLTIPADYKGKGGFPLWWAPDYKERLIVPFPVY